jgi:hypothetical protein
LGVFLWAKYPCWGRASNLRDISPGLQAGLQGLLKIKDTHRP